MSSKYQISVHFGNNKVDQALLKAIEEAAKTIGISKSKYVRTILLEEHKSRVQTRMADISSPESSGEEVKMNQEEIVLERKWGHICAKRKISIPTRTIKVFEKDILGYKEAPDTQVETACPTQLMNRQPERTIEFEVTNRFWLGKRIFKEL